MNNKLRNLFLVAFTLVLASCMGEVADPADSADVLGGNVAPVSEQVEAITASIADVKAVKEGLNKVSGLQNIEVFKAQLDACVSGIESHIASVNGGMPAQNATLAAMQLQAEIAEVVGAIKAYAGELSEIATLEKGVKSWIGNKFENYYLATSECAKVKAMSAIFEAQALNVDALISDVEAGLRTEDTTGSLAEVEATVAKSSSELSGIIVKLESLCSELESGYESAIKSSSSDSKKALKSLNTKAGELLDSTLPTLNQLLVRMEECEEAIADIEERLTKVETDIQELVGMIQSLTFISEYSEDYAVAYYNLDMSNNRHDGKKLRRPLETMELNYMVRPASAAAALTNENVSVVGYYAGRIDLQAPSTIDFEVRSVVADPSTGIVTITMENNFSEAFFFKETGAKVALSVAAGKTDMTSKFVEVYPKDASSNVYIEKLELSSSSIEIKKGKTANLSVIFTPNNVTENGVIWSTSNYEVASVDNGVVSGDKVGDATITVTSVGTDEWGLTLTASCSVKVEPNIELAGAEYVEINGTGVIKVESTAYVAPGDIQWSLSDTRYASIAKQDDGTAIITGIGVNYDTDKKEYVPIYVNCKVGEVDPMYLSRELRVVHVQPKSVAIEGLANDATSMVLKIGDTYQINPSVMPNNVDMTLFRFTYQTRHAAVANVDYYSGLVTTSSVGSAEIMTNVFSESGQDYFYPKGKTLTRYVTFKVEPYYVTSVILPETMTMAPGAVATIAPEFTSDVDGKQPTYQNLAWSSSDPGVVSIDPITGEMVAIKDGTVEITAVTSNSQSVPDGSSHKSATCMVTVVTPTVPIKIGDYYYDDGTWSTELDNSKTVIGVIFSTINAASSDVILRQNYSHCTHGLVVGLKEYQSAFGGYYGDYYSNDQRSIRTYLNSKSVETTNDKPNGFGLTWAYGEYRKDYASYNYVESFDETNGIAAKHNAEVPVSAEFASTWYIPSYCEMLQLYQNLTVVNPKLAVGNQIGTGHYMLSTMQLAGKYNDSFAYPFDMNAGSVVSVGDPKTEVCYVRVVLAF